MGVVVTIILFWLLIGGGIGAAIGATNEKPAVGFFLGAFFGPVGWIVMAVWHRIAEADSTRFDRYRALQGAKEPSFTQVMDLRVCPFCAEHIKIAAIKCRYCGSDVSPRAQSEPESPSGVVWNELKRDGFTGG